MATISAARAAAFPILLAVERGSAHADDLLRGRAVERLSEQDRHLTTALVLGALRWQLVLDAQVRLLLARPNAKLDAEVRVALRLGALQILFMDRIPAHAAIDESVELLKHAGHTFAARMANAVLRKLAGRAGEARARTQAAAREAYPEWMTARWEAKFGAEATGAICAYGQEPGSAALRMVDEAAEEELARAGVLLEPGCLLTAARRVTAGDVMATAAFQEGRVRWQDEGSQLIAELAAASADAKSARMLDCCAAPGGKTLLLAERNGAARIVACEASAARFELLRARVAALGDRVECRLADAAALTEEGGFDVVLADVPCSGTGTLGRNPEIRHRLREEDLPRQAARQRAILGAALRAAQPGGVVVYSTCSLETEENEQVVAAVRTEANGASVVPMRDRLADLRWRGVLTAEGAEALERAITPEGFLRLLPGALGTDGFFAAALMKRQR